MNSKKGKISVSMMCIRIDQIMDYIKVINEYDIELLHIDVMDGCFVSNLTVGTDYVKQLRELTDIPFDFHFMVDSPEHKLQWFDIRPGDYVAVHYESTKHIDKCMQYIKSVGAVPILALNPGTPICMIEECLDYIGGVLVMSVNPGFAGQKLIPSTIEKVRKLKAYLKEIGREDIFIESDGNMSNENAKLFYEAGSTVFVAGTSSLIKEDVEGLGKRIEEKRSAIGW